MNILFITSETAYFQNAFGGAETSIRLLAASLAKNGHNVFYVAKDHSGALLPGFKHYGFDGVRVSVFHFMRGPRMRLMRVFNDKLLEWRLTRFIGKHNIQIAYCHYQDDNLRLLIRVREKLGSFKVVMRMPGMKWYEQCLKDQKWIGVYQDIFNQIDAVNYNHKDLEEMVAEKIEELNLDVNFRYVFHGDIGAPVSPGRPAPYGRNESGVFTMVMASRFSYYQKRQDILVRAVAMLDPEKPVSVRLIGNGPRRPEIEAMIEALGLNDRVTVMPFLPQEKLWALLLDSDLMCHACEYEGLSKIILESMALGLPVLASDVSPVNSYIIDGKNGFLVANDPAAWAERIEALMADAALRKTVSLNSMAYVEENHDPERNVRIYEKHFEQIIRQ